MVDSEVLREFVESDEGLGGPFEPFAEEAAMLVEPLGDPGDLGLIGDNMPALCATLGDEHDDGVGADVEAGDAGADSERGGLECHRPFTLNSARRLRLSLSLAGISSP